VAAAPRGYAGRTQSVPARVVVGHDATQESEAALAAAVDIARRADAPLEVVEAVTPAGADAAAIRLDAVVRSLGSPGMTSRCVLAGPPGELLDLLRPSDLLVLGSAAYAPALRMMLAGVARAGGTEPCPVLVVPSAAHEAALAA
jgi:hypothetical protein